MTNNNVILLCSLIALFVLAGCIALVIWKRRDLKTVIRILGVTAFVLLFVLIFPAYYATDERFAVGLALVESMCAMLLNSSASSINEMFSANTFDVAFLEAYKTGLLVVLIVAPLFTIGITLSFFSDKFTRILYAVRSHFSDSYIFSAINERTLTVAEDTVKKHKGAVILFAVEIDKDDIDAESMARMKEMRAYFVDGDVVGVRHSLRKKRSYYLLDEAGKNLEPGLRLYEKYNGKSNGRICMWLYSRDEISEVIFDYLYEDFDVRMINEEGLVARQLVSEHPLYKSIKNGHLSVLVVGAGLIGLEIIKTVAMCSCLGDGVTTEINVIDLDAEKAKKKLELTSPHLAEKWNIKFYSADIYVSDLSNILSKISPTYVVISLGEETKNLDTAIYIRRFYGESDGLPHIHAIVEHIDSNEQIIPNLCVSDWSYDKETHKYKDTPLCSLAIMPFGSFEETYSNLRVGESYRDCLAIAINAVRLRITALSDVYTREVLADLYNQVLYYKKYADAFAVCVPYKLYLLGLELCDDGEGDLSLLDSLSEADIVALAAQENKRFECFMRSIGWTDMTPDEVKKSEMHLRTLRDKLKQKYARLDNTHVEELSELTGRDFAAEDKRNASNLGAVLKLANELFGKNYSVRKIK